MHRLSFLWYVTIGVITTFVCSAISIPIFGKNTLGDFDRRLLAPYIRKYLPEHIPLSNLKGEEMKEIKK